MELTQKTKQAILDGAYAMTRNGCKVRYLCNSTNPVYPLVFIIIPPKLNHYNPSKDIDTILITEDTWRATIHPELNDSDIVGLWVEPTSKVTLELPKPFKPKKQETFFTLTSTAPYRPLEVRGTYNADSEVDKNLIEAGLCFKTEQDAQAWVDAFKKAFNE